MKGILSMRAKRILWILNHKTLMKFEVPLLRELGYEVYIPKKPPFDISIDVDWESDKLLSVPQEDLDVLNGFDFYVDNMTPDVAAIINKYFDIVMFIHIPRTIESMVDWFKGMLVLRAYGRLECEGSYTDVIMSSLGLGYFKKIEALGSRFVFSESYKGLSDIECEFFRNHTLYMPIGMPDEKHDSEWVNTQRKVLFVCPNIKAGSSIHEKRYEIFKRDFKKIPYSIAGGQMVNITNDPNVLGYLRQEEYDSLFLSYSCVYYDSTEKNSISFVPFEAVKFGIPLLFMAGGLLDKLGGKSLPGRCTSVTEARNKAQRLVKGDAKFAEKIRHTQKVLLEKFSMQYAIPFWKSSLNRAEKNLPDTLVPLFGRKKRRLCVMLSEGYTGGVLDYTIRVIEAIKRGIDKAHDDVELVFAPIDSPNFKDNDYFKPIRNMDIPIRPFTFKSISRQNAEETVKIMGVDHKFTEEKYCLPCDGINYFSDCDSILLTCDRVPENVLFLQPYGVIAHDYIQRLNPSIFPETYSDAPILALVRNAKAVFTSTPVTKAHLIQYAGVKEENAHIIPVPFSVFRSRFDNASAPPMIDKDYFLWSTNTNKHKNHKVALDALSLYYANGGHLMCIVTGANTELFSPQAKISNDNPYASPYVLDIAKIIKNNKKLKSNMRFMGNLPKLQYMNILRNAQFLIHPGAADNGNGTAFDAAYEGVPTISSDYAPMRFYNQYFSLNMLFFDYTDAEALAEQLFYMEDHLLEIKNALPTRSQLEKQMVSSDEIYTNIYQIIKTNLAIT